MLLPERLVPQEPRELQDRQGQEGVLQDRRVHQARMERMVLRDQQGQARELPEHLAQLALQVHPGQMVPTALRVRQELVLQVLRGRRV